MSTSRIVVNPAAGEQRRQLSPTRTRVTVFGAGRGAREPRVAAGGDVRLTVLDGRMAVACGDATAVLEAGESIVIGGGVEHAWWSTRAGALRVEIETASGAGQHDGQDRRASGTTGTWRSWSWSNLVPIGWAPSALR
jgi:mannose-6-phosphate isomerase-like protein (cupin superfamily)